MADEYVSDDLIELERQILEAAEALDQENGALTGDQIEQFAQLITTNSERFELAQSEIPVLREHPVSRHFSGT
mgnify:CR=1 FL=1